MIVFIIFHDTFHDTFLDNFHDKFWKLLLTLTLYTEFGLPNPNESVYNFEERINGKIADLTIDLTYFFLPDSLKVILHLRMMTYVAESYLL